MAILLEFDAGHNIVRGTMKGRLTDAIILDCQALATRYTKSHPPCRGIWDYSDVTDFQLSGDAVRQVERRRPVIATGYASVVVAPQDYVYGMMRMLQILSEGSRPELSVVRSLNEAYGLLQVESPAFVSVAPE